jgi:ERCC4-related helicase
MKSHRKTASQELTGTANNVIEIKNETMPVNTPSETKSNLTELDMLLQPPTPSAKASKKRQTRKATPIALHNQRSQHNKRNNKKNNKNHSRVAMPAMPAADMSCSNINRAKQCKSNPKCFYDYVEFKCKDKSERPALQFPKLAGSKKRSKKTQKEKQPNQPSMRNNKKNTTKELLQALQKSFKTIGNEARQDSKLLAKASERI